ncbi:MAG: nicotinamide riboside transporter PnuC [Rubrivivax sp.]|nr:MAG: nicotinamide riboside transporter PnuC [Rubrivivax sp.]
MGNVPVSELFAWADPWLTPLFSAWGVPVSALEVWAFALSVAMVLFNLRVNPWGWPLAIVSSLLYGVLFARSKLYGEAGLQLVFVALSCWGWWQWLWGHDRLQQALSPRTLSRPGRQTVIILTFAMWPLLSLLLDHATDSDVPYLDAFPTAASLVGQWLLGRKYIENWATWLFVNVVSMALFAYKGLWLTVILYALFAMLSVLGWRQWQGLATPKRMGLN